MIAFLYQVTKFRSSCQISLLCFFDGKVKPPRKPYFTNASTMYEEFFNKKWKEASLNYNSEPNFLKDYLKERENIKNDESKLNN